MMVSLFLIIVLPFAALFAPGSSFPKGNSLARGVPRKANSPAGQPTPHFGRPDAESYGTATLRSGINRPDIPSRTAIRLQVLC